MIVKVQNVDTESNWLFYLSVLATKLFRADLYCKFSVSEHLNIVCFRCWSHHGSLMSMSAKPAKKTWKVPLAGSQGALSCTPTCVTVLTNEYKSWEQHTRARSELHEYVFPWIPMEFCTSQGACRPKDITEPAKRHHLVNAGLGQVSPSWPYQRFVTSIAPRYAARNTHANPVLFWPSCALLSLSSSWKKLLMWTKKRNMASRSFKSEESWTRGAR